MTSYALPMNQHQVHPDIYQLRIVLRGISPLIWRRLLVSSATTLAQLHQMLQILFAWSNAHLHEGVSELWICYPLQAESRMEFPPKDGEDV